jgi:hypothetical protein
MGEREQQSPTVDGLLSLVVKPIVGFFRYFIPPMECSISISEDYNHTLFIKNTDKRKLLILSIHPLKGLLKRKYSVKVYEKLIVSGKYDCKIYYPFNEMEWCFVVIKRFLPIPILKEVKELKKKEFWVV